MELTGLEPDDLVALARALRDGEPVRLDHRGPLPRGIRLDEIAPLCHEIRVRDPQVRAALNAFRAPPAKPGSTIRVTVVVPCHRHPPLGLRALLGQDVAVRVLVLSNGGAGPDVVPGAEVVRVPWKGHGATRQAAVELVEDPYVLFTVDDAIPLGAGCLRTLVEELERGRWDAVVARQVPWPDSDRVTRERLRQWTPAGVQTTEMAQVDNVATLYRTEVLRAHPFPAVPIAEDAWWSPDRFIGFVPMAPVLHSHRRAAGDLYRRTRDIHAELVRMGRPPTVPSLGALVSDLQRFFTDHRRICA